MDEAEFGVDDISEEEYNRLKEKIMAKSINRREFNKLMLASGLSAAALSKSFGVSTLIGFPFIITILTVPPFSIIRFMSMDSICSSFVSGILLYFNK